MTMPAPTPDEIFTNTELSMPRATPMRCSARAPRLASFSTWTSVPNASLPAAWASTPGQPGQDRGALDHAVGHRGRPARGRSGAAGCRPGGGARPCPRPAPAPPGAPARGRWCTAPRRGAVRRGRRWRRRGGGGRSRRRPRRRRRATSTPTSPGDRCPPLSRRGRPRTRSRTMFDTVAGASPVRRASSAWVRAASSGEASRSASSTAAQVRRPQRGGRTGGGCWRGHADTVPGASGMVKSRQAKPDMRRHRRSFVFDS